MFFSTIVSALLLAASANNCNASPINAQSLIVFSPRITYPKAGMTWSIGSTHNVTWDTSNIPREKKGSMGRILLGYNGTESENLDVEHPLATAFPIDHGRVSVTVPKHAKPRDDYFIVLFGDSGNMSPKFKIRKP
ncbi:hypothetical protein D9615_008890 [Tricholomella constricta]|uniref:Yeast cell wall synthesis Kre9/Knh1-like N-terminal domain-containing protein n=1 Tax=Tricholomella constricta TaxID=117010 RepID=A0A8H5GZH3_9AGAR|nr:hypothetical protein D9615_008890 [Tricholomella constricta]